MRFWWVIVFMNFGFAARAKNQGSLMMPHQIEQGQLEDKAGAQVPPDIKLTTQDNQKIIIKKYFNHNKPIILTLGYYQCPMLCSLVLNGLLEVLQKINYKAGEDYILISVSIDHRETPELAQKKQANHVKALGIDPKYWTFHTASKEEIFRLADTLGFNYYFDSRNNQFAHGAGFFVLSETGKLSRTLFGIKFKPTDLRLALTEASEGKVGSFLDKVLLSCFHYDPDSHRYGIYIFGVMRLGGILTILIMGVVLLMYFRFEQRRNRGQANG